MSTLPAELQWDQARLKDHVEALVINMLLGRVTPVLGAGASLYGRAAIAPPPPGDGAAQPTWQGAPTAGELAKYLAKRGKISDVTNDLLRVAQWVYAKLGSTALYEFLHDQFDRDFPPTDLHTFLGEIPGELRDAEQGYPPLIVTTNYDDLVEQALDARDEEYDVLVYMAEGTNKGLFCHVVDGGELKPITEPETYLDVNPEIRTVVLKIHGFVSRADKRADSYVITEDHYIDYLGRMDLSKLLPQYVMERLGDSILLFLGYSLRDWNVRAMLRYIYTNRTHDNQWWAVQLDPDVLDIGSWEQRNVKIVPMRLEQYVPALRNEFLSQLEEAAADSE